jgi:hypothetical protein
MTVNRIETESKVLRVKNINRGINRIMNGGSA